MKIVPTLLALCATAALCAQTPAPQPDSTLSARVERLETKNSKWSRVLEHLPRISGYLQTGYEWSDNSSTFFIKRIRLSLAGDIVRDKLDYRLQVEFASSPKIVDAYVQYTPCGALNIKVGQYKVPFSIENTDYPPLRLELIDYPMALQRLMGLSEPIGGGTLASTGRDMGATLWGGLIERDGYRLINYDFGVFNGSGINTKDKNRSKDIAARLTLKPVRGLLLSGSYYRGEYGENYLRRVRYGAGVCYDRGAGVVRGEWIGGKTGDTESAGWYVTGGWRATRSLMPVVRYDTYESDTSRASVRQTNYTAGLVWAPVKYLRCQLNYTYEDYADRQTDGRNVLTAMFTGMF